MKNITLAGKPYRIRVRKHLIEKCGFAGDAHNIDAPLVGPDGEYPIDLGAKTDLVRVTKGMVSCHNFDQYITTPQGSFRRDESGLWHYRPASPESDNLIYATDAINCHPSEEPAWFWLLGTPAPMVVGDTPEILDARWSKWRKVCEDQGATELLVCLQDLTNLK